MPSSGAMYVEVNAQYLFKALLVLNIKEKHMFRRGFYPYEKKKIVIIRNKMENKIPIGKINMNELIGLWRKMYDKF